MYVFACSNMNGNEVIVVRLQLLVWAWYIKRTMAVLSCGWSSVWENKDRQTHFISLSRMSVDLSWCYMYVELWNLKHSRYIFVMKCFKCHIRVTERQIRPRDFRVKGLWIRLKFEESAAECLLVRLTCLGLHALVLCHVVCLSSALFIGLFVCMFICLSRPIFSSEKGTFLGYLRQSSGTQTE